MKVIAISGASGAGKTTLINALSTKYSSESLFFDDFVEPDTYPADINYWLENGADVNQINNPRFTEAIFTAISNNDSRNNVSDFLFIEEPFGRLRDELLPAIDYVIYLNLPLAICLARVVGRSIKQGGAMSLSGISQYLANYQTHLFALYHTIGNRVKATADCTIIDQHLTTPELVERLSIRLTLLKHHQCGLLSS